MTTLYLHVKDFKNSNSIDAVHRSVQENDQFGNIVLTIESVLESVYSSISIEGSLNQLMNLLIRIQPLLLSEKYKDIIDRVPFTSDQIAGLKAICVCSSDSPQQNSITPEQTIVFNRIQEVLTEHMVGEHITEETKDSAIGQIMKMVQNEFSPDYHTFEVVCDKSNNSEESISNNKLNVDIYVHRKLLKLDFTIDDNGEIIYHA